MNNSYKQILITGGTGFVGSYLVEKLLKQGHYITVLTRNPDKYGDDARNLTYTGWDGNTSLTADVEQADVIINLAGENIFGQRWTEQVKHRIMESRTQTTQMLSHAIKEAKEPPELFISASAVGYYGDNGEKELDEAHESGSDFLARVCKKWETAAAPVADTNTRLVIPRIGIVLEKDGGALENMLPAFKLFAGGPVGSGEQFVPWIHMNDLCRAMLFFIENTSLSGIFNICAPNPVTMNRFAATLGETLNRPSFFRVPEFVLNIALGEAATPILASLNAKPKNLLDAGFEFKYEHIEMALHDII